MIKVGKIKENGEIEREYHGQGHIFKDQEAFYEKDGICYVSELSDTQYTYDDFVRIANNNLTLAKLLFDFVNWQSPSTLYDEWLSISEIKECDNCKKTFLTEGDEDMECPYCDNNKEENKCICAETNCILSTELEYKGDTIFADLRLDLDHEEKSELDINIGFINPETRKVQHSVWSDSLPIKYCMVCGQNLKYRHCYK